MQMSTLYEEKKYYTPFYLHYIHYISKDVRRGGGEKRNTSSQSSLAFRIIHYFIHVVALHHINWPRYDDTSMTSDLLTSTEAGSNQTERSCLSSSTPRRWFLLARDHSRRSLGCWSPQLYKSSVGRMSRQSHSLDPTEHKHLLLVTSY